MNTEDIPMTAPTLVPVTEARWRADLLDAAVAHLTLKLDPELLLLVGDDMMTRQQIELRLQAEAARLRRAADAEQPAAPDQPAAEDTPASRAAQAHADITSRLSLINARTSPAALAREVRGLCAALDPAVLTAAPVLGRVKALIDDAQQSPRQRIEAALALLVDDMAGAFDPPQQPDAQPAPATAPPTTEGALLQECFCALQHLTLGQALAGRVDPTLLARVSQALNITP